MQQDSIVGFCSPEDSATRPAAGSASRDLDGLGRPTNSGLSNFASEGRSGLQDALKSTSKVRSLYMGIDTAEWSLKIPSPDLAGMAVVLDQLVGQGEIVDDDRQLVVSRVGLPYRYKMAIADGFDLYFPAPDHPEIPLRIHAGARVCLMLGADLEDEVLHTLAWWLAWSDDKIREWLRLSRVDVCQDLQMARQAFNHMSKLVASNSRAVVTRGRYRQAFPTGTGYTGFAIGKNEVRLRLYDKLVDAENKGTLEMWSEVYGQGEAFEVPDGQVVARVEFQLRGEFLRGCCTHPGGHPDGGECPGLRTLADFKHSADMVLDYLSDDWFRLAGPDRGKNHERPVLPIWKAIRAGFVKVHWSELADKLRRRARAAVGKNLDRLFGQAGGLLASAAAVLGHHADEDTAVGLGAALHALGEHIRRDFDKWKNGRDRRYSALRYSSKVNLVPYLDAFTGKPIPIGGAT